MQLEILSSQPSSPSHPVPVVFVHGAWHGAWCWTEHFLPYFAERGYEAHALSLRGHGGSPGRERLRWTSLAEYVADVASVLEGLPRAPVLVGHSMGGAVVQQFLETHTLPGAVLLASVPPAGALRAALRVARRHPLQFAKANLTLSLYPLIDTPRLAREAFWGASMAPGGTLFPAVAGRSLPRVSRYDRVRPASSPKGHDPRVGDGCRRRHDLHARRGASDGPCLQHRGGDLPRHGA
jgi:pimeloyl-ACP methyl ester carboxylesterase